MKFILTSIFVVMTTFFSLAQDFDITNVKVEQDAKLNQLIFSVEVAGTAGATVPTAIGALDGAPVLGYVFPTTLNSTDVGFDDTEGIVALALTSHPDFDDTPIWDENMDGIFDNDGVVWHPHWVLLEDNIAVSGGLAVKATTATSVLPPTNPGMPMYMDSPGFQVVTSGNTIHCTVPIYRMNQKVDFNYDGVTVLMNVNTSDPNLPLLGVYEVFEIASGDLSLPYSVGNYSCDTLIFDISTSTIGLINPETIKVFPNPTATDVQVELSAGFDLNSYEVQIFNSTGTMVYQQDLDSQNISIPVSNIGASGMYIISIIESTSGIIKGSKQLIIN